MVLARGERRVRPALDEAVSPRARHLARHRLAALVRGRRVQLRRELPRPPPRRRPRRQGRAGVGERRRRDADPDLCGAGAGDGARGPRAPPPRRGRRRPRGHLPAHVPGSGDRHPGRGAPRRDLHAVLLRLRRPGRGLATARLRGEGPDHGRQLPAPRPRRADEADGGRGRGRVAVRAPRGGRSPPGRRRAVDRRAATCGGTTWRREEPRRRRRRRRRPTRR